MKSVFATLAMLFMLAGAGAQTFVGITQPPQTYGTQGTDIPLGTPALPSWATVTVTGASTWSWASTVVGGTAWYQNTPFTISVAVNDGQTHQLAMLLRDYDNQSRVETINGQMFSGFGTGEYAVWTVSGTSVFTVTWISGPNAVVNGLYFDPAQGVTPPPPTVHQINLTWTPATTGSAATSFIILRGTSSGTETQLATVPAPASSYADTTGASGTKYFYIVEAANSAGNSVASNEVSATFAVTLTPPDPPTGLAAAE